MNNKTYYIETFGCQMNVADSELVEALLKREGYKPAPKLEDADAMFLIDITEEAMPFPISSFQVPAQPGNFCERGGRFGPHSVHDAYHPKFDKTLVVLSYFNAGIRVVDIRNPFQPVEVGYFIPETTSNTAEDCITINETEHCNRAIQTNNVNIDDRGFIYAVDRANTGLHIVELTGTARGILERP